MDVLNYGYSMKNKSSCALIRYLLFNLLNFHWYVATVRNMKIIHSICWWRQYLIEEITKQDDYTDIIYKIRMKGNVHSIWWIDSIRCVLRKHPLVLETWRTIIVKNVEQSRPKVRQDIYRFDGGSPRWWRDWWALDIPYAPSFNVLNIKSTKT